MTSITLVHISLAIMMGCVVYMCFVAYSLERENMSLRREIASLRREIADRRELDEDERKTICQRCNKVLPCDWKYIWCRECQEMSNEILDSMYEDEDIDADLAYDERKER